MTAGDPEVEAGVVTGPFDAAFTAAIERDYVALAGFAALLCGDRDEAEDLVAEAYARAWPAYRRGNVDDITGYAKRCVANLASDRWRRRRLERRETTSRRLDWRLADDRRWQSSGEGSQSIDARVLRAVRSLPRDQRAVVVCRHMLDMSEVDTADLLGLRLGTVKSRLTRGLAALRVSLGGLDD